MKKSVILCVAVIMVVMLKPALGQAPDEKAAIRQAALDYIEGWYEGDAARMDRALHAELVKRAIFATAGAEKFANLTKA